MLNRFLLNLFAPVLRNPSKALVLVVSHVLPVLFYLEESWSRRDEASGLGLTFVSLEVSAVQR